MKPFFKNTQRAIFISRPNRFVVNCEFKGKIIGAFLPNTGRLMELLLPGATIYIEEANRPERKIPFTAVAVEKNGCPVMIHTHKTNDVAQYLIEKGSVPLLEGARVLKREVTKGGSRFDFLLREEAKDIFLEVKSCTLFSQKAASFPDAVTSRGKRHIEELVHLSKGNTSGAVLFLVHWPNADYFLPEYHTDIDFAKTLYSARDKIRIIPLAIGWKKSLTLNTRVKLLEIPWKTFEHEMEDRGNYLLILRLADDTVLEVGKLGERIFKKGYYIYVGSAKKNLSKRIKRHQRLRKKLFWHIDYLRAKTEYIAALPIRTKDDLECDVAAKLKRICDSEIKGFGSSDCSCNSHLFRMNINPLCSQNFHRIIQYYRMDRLFEDCDQAANISL